MTSLNLCKNQDCAEEPNDSSSIKCTLCDGYFQDDGLNDIYFLSENGETGECSLCGKTKDICVMKGTGQQLCTDGCSYGDSDNSDTDNSDTDSDDGKSDND